MEEFTPEQQQQELKRLKRRNQRVAILLYSFLFINLIAITVAIFILRGVQ